MNFEDTIHAGPFNLPVRYLVFAAAAAAGYVVMSLVFLKRGELRRAAGGRLLNALVLFVVVWKLEPMGAALTAALARGKVSLQSVLLQVFVPGGSAAAIIGAGAASIYLIAWVLRSGRPAWRHAAAIGAAVLPAVLLFLGMQLLLQPRTGGLTAERRSPAPVSALPIGTSVGDRAPYFDTKSLDGRTYRLGDARGRMIVLNFWATWCPPCRAELPDLVRFAASQTSRRAAVWAVNMTNSEPSTGAVRSFARLYGIDFPVLLDPAGSIAHDYNVTAVPTTFVISSDGVILAKQVGAMSPGWLRSRTELRSR